ncbi:MAG: hypothetical protein ABSH40_01530 [Bryobacteraceae bacterium]|jgi:hypothetical protein
MLASVLIIVISAVLFAYWFRYSCILLLRNSAAPATSPVDARFRFIQVQESLKSDLELDPLHKSLQRDYQILCYLLRHAAGLELASFEDRILVLDYKVMQAWYRLTRTAAPAQARRALVEMSEVLGILVRRLGEQASIRNEA